MADRGRARRKDRMPLGQADRGRWPGHSWQWAGAWHRAWGEAKGTVSRPLESSDSCQWPWPVAWARCTDVLAEYHKEAEQGREGQLGYLECGGCVVCRSLVSLAANRPAGNLALKAPRESGLGTRKETRR